MKSIIYRCRWRLGPVAALRICLLVSLTWLAGCAAKEQPLPVYPRWGMIELVFHGPSLTSLGEPNPFAIAFDVMFTGPGGAAFLVPGFYDGDGHGGLGGDIWKVRFAADRNGVWSWHTQSPDPRLNARSGRFGVIDPPPDAPPLWRLGRLEYVNERYLKFREGSYWIQAGAAGPENLLAAADRQATKRRIDSLAAAGVNSVRVVASTLGGSNDIWPWVGATPEEATQHADRYDIARLEEWRRVFDYLQSKGIVVHLVLEGKEAWTGYDHTRYYREMVARFGYLPALCFDFDEAYGERYALEEALHYMKLLGTIDPYQHPRAVHGVNFPRPDYIDSPAVQLASIQTGPSKPATLNQLAVDWFGGALTRNARPLVVSFDEARPAVDRRSWWSVFLGGGVWASRLPAQEDPSRLESAWRELRLARAFLESLPVERMFPANHLVRQGEAFCLARPGEVYALYLPYGGRIELELAPGNRYRAQWFDPRSTRADPRGKTAEIDGGLQAFTAPAGEDWALRIERIAGEAQAPPVAVSAALLCSRNAPVAIHLATLPGDSVEALRYQIVTPPTSGSLTGEGADRTYTPRRGFTGRDHFTWRAAGPAGESNVATVTITANAAGVNIPPRAYNGTVRARAGQPRAFLLRYADRDGPGPYHFRITRPPDHGAVRLLDNEATYTPEPGYRGPDSFQWQVNDGEDHSNTATVRITVPG